MRALIVRVYGWLLRLYPPRFRESFAAEMRDVFAQAVREAGTFRLAALCARELWELPSSLLREHLRERRVAAMEIPSGYGFLDRFCIISILTGVILYLALIILPFPGLFRFTCYYYRGAYY